MLRAKQVLLCTLMCALLCVQVSSVDEKSCQRKVITPTNLYINVFNELISNHTDIVRTLKMAPIIGDMDQNAPSFEFQEAGFHLTDTYLSDKMRRMSCSSNEVAFYWSIFFKDSDTSGPLIELSYGDGLGTSFPVFSVYTDASADEIIIAYRHLGKLHVEIFNVRLHGGKWRTYAVTLSGNQASLYINCELTYQRIVPLPDYCANDSSLMLSVADSTSNVEGTERRLRAFLQNVGVSFGSRGIMKVCPDIEEVCPSCGQFLQLVERVYSLNEEIERLKLRVATLESQGVSIPPICTATPSLPAGSGSNCTELVNGVSTTFADGTFVALDLQSVCYCTNGESQCSPFDSVCKSTTAPTATTSVSTTSAQVDDTGQTDPPSRCTVPELGDKKLLQGEYASLKQANRCKVFSCSTSIFGTNLQTTFYGCSANYSTCLSNFTELQREISECCLLCDVCSFTSCPENSQCIAGDNGDEHTCTCKDGYERLANGSCQDFNECLSVGLRTCPPNSVCRNTEGSFDCLCDPGYNMAVSSTGVILCEDDDECTSDVHNCTMNTDCINTPGGFDCKCSNGYSLTDDGKCLPLCNPPCQNGGMCTSPGTCTCQSGYTGGFCESDINECIDKKTCSDPRQDCVNTVGGFFCRCRVGFKQAGRTCEDINECDTHLHNCIPGSTCFNLIGSYKCFCSETDCTGVCLHLGQVIQNRRFVLDNRCKNCTCVDGELSCSRVQCDCTTNPQRNCCPDCYRRNCVIKNGTVRIRPKSTWINPQNRCERYYCSSKGNTLTPIMSDVAADCPQLDCPANLTVMPMGNCCPICLLPACNENNNRQRVNLRNGCETCACNNSVWRCTQKYKCPEVNCDPQHILFNKGGCCPVCASEALSTTTCLQ